MLLNVNVLTKDQKDYDIETTAHTCMHNNNIMAKLFKADQNAPESI